MTQPEPRWRFTRRPEHRANNAAAPYTAQRDAVLIAFHFWPTAHFMLSTSSLFFYWPHGPEMMWYRVKVSFIPFYSFPLFFFLLSFFTWSTKTSHATLLLAHQVEAIDTVIQPQPADCFLLCFPSRAIREPWTRWFPRSLHCNARTFVLGLVSLLYSLNDAPVKKKKKKTVLGSTSPFTDFITLPITRYL